MTKRFLYFAYIYFNNKYPQRKYEVPYWLPQKLPKSLHMSGTVVQKQFEAEIKYKLCISNWE